MLAWFLLVKADRVRGMKDRGAYQVGRSGSHVMSIQNIVSTGSDYHSHPMGNASIEEREIFMFQSLHSPEEAGRGICLYAAVTN